MPMNSSSVEGRKVFPGARGMPRAVNRVRSSQRAVEHKERGGGRAMKKSSRMCNTPRMFSLEWIIHSIPSESKLKR